MNTFSFNEPPPTTYVSRDHLLLVAPDIGDAVDLPGLRVHLLPGVVDRRVGVATETDGPSEGHGGVVAREDTVLVEVANVELHGGVVLRREELVGPRAAGGGRGGGI